MVLTGVAMISEPKNIIVGMEVMPLSIHVIKLFIRGRLYSTLSIRIVPMAKVAPQEGSGSVNFQNSPLLGSLTRPLIVVASHYFK